MIKIFYKKVPKSVDVCEKDIGIFINKIKTFGGKQYLLKEYKIKNLYKYQKLFASFANKNKMFFNVLGINIETACNLFFIKTYDSLGIESFGNILTLIDILEDISRKNNLNLEKIVCYVPNEEIKSIFRQFFKNKGIKNYKIKIIENRFFKFLRLKIIELLYCFYFFKILFRWLFGNIYNRRSNNKICLISPLETTIDIYKNVKYKILSKGIYFDYVIFDTKNKFFKNFLRIEYYLYLIKKLIKRQKSIYIGQFLEFTDIFLIIKEYLKKRNKLKKINTNCLKYRNIILKTEIKKFLNLYIYIYLLVIIESIIIIRRLIKQYEIILYTYNDEPLLEILFVIPKKNKKIVSLQYELIYPGCVYYFNNNKQNIELVWNEYSKKILVDFYNYPKNKVFVIGNIRFEKIKKKRNNKNKKLNVVFTTQDAFPEVLDMFLSTIKKVNNPYLNYIIKPHPGENMKDIYKKIKTTNKTKIVTKPINRVLEFTDILISYTSTTLLEAIYNKIPCIVINPYKTTPYRIPIYNYIPYFKNEKKLLKFLNELDMKKLKKIKIPRILIIYEFNSKLLEELLFS